MKKRNRLSVWLAMTAIAFWLPTFCATAQVTWQENFDYPTGDLYGQGGWGKYGSNPNDPIQVVDQRLDYDGYPGGTKGKSVRLGKEKTAEDLLVRFDPSEDGIKTGTVYYSALVNVSTPPTGDVYFMSLLPRTSKSVVTDGTSPTELGRLFAGKGSSDNTFTLGVDRGSQKPEFSATEYETGKTYLIVVKYEIGKAGKNYDGVSLFVNPASFDVEPSTPDAEIDPTKTGSGVVNYGLQGFELRQGTSSKADAPEMIVGSLRIADSYKGLFYQDGQPGEDNPTISISEKKLEFGGVYSGSTVEKTLKVSGKNLKGDINIAVSGTELKVEKTFVSAAEAENAGGADVTFTLTPVSENGTATVTFSSEGTDDVVIEATWNTVPVKEMATLKDFEGEDGEAYLTYRYTGKAVVTFVDKSGAQPVYYIQDETGGMQVKNNYEMLTSEYKAGDIVTGFVGMIETSLGANSFIPLTPTLGTLVSQGNTVEPVTATLAEIKIGPKNYVNRLVKISGATFKDIAEGATFEEGMAQPTISDETGEGKLRIFKGTTLIGKAIPSGAVNITGLSTSAAAVLVAPRGIEDIESAEASAPSLEISPETLPETAGTVGKSTVMGKIHISTKGLERGVSLYVTGTNRNMFSIPTETIGTGDKETDVTVTYSPTAVGKHQGRLNIECIDNPELSTYVSLNAYAIDENNKPTVTVDADALVPFTAKVGESSTQTIKVTTANLPDYGKIAMKEAGTFVLNNTMLLKNGTQDVKITFSPKAAGKYSNTIIISGLALDSIKINVEGTATDGEITDEPEGDKLPLDTSSPVTLLDEHFNGGVKNKPLEIEGWKNLALEGTRAWWGYEFPEDGEDAGEKAAKVTAYDSKVESGKGTPAEMMLVTPALDFRNAKSKVFTFRVRGDYLLDDQTDLLELCYIDMAGGEMYVAPVGGFNMPATKDESGTWQEYHIDLTGQDLADVFFMGFKFKSTRGTDNSATYYVDDVSFGRTDLAVIRPSVTELSFNAVVGSDAQSQSVGVEAENLTGPITLSMGGANKSKFNLSATELPAAGGSFTVSFNSDTKGLHEAYVRLSSRGAADIYIPVIVNNEETSGIGDVDVNKAADITVFDLSGKKVKEGKNTTPDRLTKELDAGVYILKAGSGEDTYIYKVRIK